MKLIIAGSRDIQLDIGTIQNLIDTFIPDSEGLPTEIVSGACSGVDMSGEHWATFQNIPIKRFKPDWNTHSKAAGPMRNKEMAEYADMLLLIHNNSKGSLNMKKQMLELNKPVYEVLLNTYLPEPKSGAI